MPRPHQPVLDIESSQANDSTPVPKNVTLSGVPGSPSGSPSLCVPSEQLSAPVTLGHFDALLGDTDL